MMEFILPHAESQLGILTVEEILDEYDALPVLFICRNELGYKYLAIAVDRDETGDVFLYVPVSVERLVAIRTGLMSLRDALSYSETGIVIAVRPGASTPDGSAVVVIANEIRGDWRPSPTSFLSESLNTAIPFSAAILSAMANQQRRPLSAVELQTSEGTLRTEFPVDKAGMVLTELQQLAEVVTLHDRPAARGEVKFDVLREGELTLTAAMAASFVFIIAPYAPRDPLMPLPSVAMDLVANVLESANLEGEEFSQSMTNYSKRTVSRLRNFLTALESSTTGVTITNAGPEMSTRSVSVPLTRVRSSLGALRVQLALPDERFDIDAHLMAINQLRNSFAAVEVAPTEPRKRPRTIYGHFDSELLDALDGLPAGKSTAYKIQLLVESEVPDVITGAKPKKKFRMLSIGPIVTQLQSTTDLIA
jgi:hypothetical protein